MFGLALVPLMILIGTNAPASTACKVSDIRAAHPNFCEPRREQKALSDAEMKTLFKDVQRDMVALVLAGRDRSALSPEERSILIRLETVEFGGFENCGNGAASVSAAYSQTEHTVQFCEALRDFPLPALVGMIGHEIGHSADSCSSQCPLMHARDRSKLTASAEEMRSDPLLREQVTRLSSMRGAGSFNTKVFLEHPALVDGWLASGAAETRAEPMPLTRYPLNRIRSCLMQKERLWSGRTTDSLPTSSTTSPGCSEQADYEGMADVWGALALGKYLERKPELRGDAALGLFESRKQEICSPKGYPATLKRLDAIWLAEPRVASALGCTPVPAHTCLRDSPFPAPSPGASASPGRQRNTPSGSTRRAPGEGSAGSGSR